MMKTWVLLRGLTREAGHWGDFPQRLAHAMPQARIICIDLPGNGAAYRLRSPLRVEAMVEHCRADLQTRGMAPPYHLLTLSLGGMAAAAWCAGYPHEIAAAVLINTSFSPINPVWQRLRPAALAGFVRLLLRRDAQAIEHDVLALTSSRPRQHQPILAQWVRLRQMHPVSRANAVRQLLAAARFAAMRTKPAPPMLLLASRADAIVDPRCTRAIAHAWRADCAWHPDAGHDLPLDDGDWVAAQVAGWIKVQANRGAGIPTAAHAQDTAAARNRPGAGS